jgi:hypothetical protein
MFKHLVTGAAIAAAASATAFAAPYLLEQEQTAGAGDFAAIGILNSFDLSSTSAADAYGFQRDERWSYDGDASGLPAAESGNILLFMTETSDGPSLFVVMDQANDGTSGQADSTWNLSGDTTAILVRDDANGNDSYSGDGTSFDFDHQWNACCTDGFVLGSLDGAFELIGGFDRLRNIDAFFALGENGQRLGLNGDEGFRVRITGLEDNLAEVPLPAAFPLGALGFAALTGMSARRRRRS